MWSFLPAGCPGPACLLWPFKGQGSSKAVLVGVKGLEPSTSASRTLRASQLRHTPNGIILTGGGQNQKVASGDWANLFDGFIAKQARPHRKQAQKNHKTVRKDCPADDGKNQPAYARGKAKGARDQPGIRS